MTNQNAETSAPIIYGLALSTPAHVVDKLVTALTPYQKRIGTRWRGYETRTQAILTLAYLEGGHSYRSLGAGNGVPKSTCRALVQEGIKVFARRALPLTEMVYLARKAGWDYLIVDGVHIPTERVANRVQASLRCIGERANAQLKCWQVLARDFRGHLASSRQS